jgi:hypothetical protein
MKMEQSVLKRRHIKFRSRKSPKRQNKTPRSRRKFEINKYSVVTDYISVIMWHDLLALTHKSSISLHLNTSTSPALLFITLQKILNFSLKLFFKAVALQIIKVVVANMLLNFLNMELFF